MRVAVDRVVEEISADAAVVEQRVALARRAVAHDCLPCGAASIKRSSSSRLVSSTRSRTSVVLGASAGPRASSRASSARTAALDRARTACVLRVDAQRPAVGRQLLDVEQT